MASQILQATKAGRVAKEKHRDHVSHTLLTLFPTQQTPEPASVRGESIHHRHIDRRQINDQWILHYFGIEDTYRVRCRMCEPRCSKPVPCILESVNQCIQFIGWKTRILHQGEMCNSFLAHPRGGCVIFKK